MAEQDKIFENPGRYFRKTGTLTDRGWDYRWQDSTRDAQWNGEFCLVPEGGHFLSVFVCSEIKHSENVLVFYWIGDPRNIVVERRIYISGRVYHLVVPKLLRVNHNDHPLTPIFDTPYGRVVENLELAKYAERGFDRMIKRVFQFEHDGRIIDRVSTNGYVNQRFLVEFHNGEVLLGFAGVCRYHGAGATGRGSLEFISAKFSENPPVELREWVSDWKLIENIGQPSNAFCGPPSPISVKRNKEGFFAGLIRKLTTKKK